VVVADVLKDVTTSVELNGLLVVIDVVDAFVWVEKGTVVIS